MSQNENEMDALRAMRQGQLRLEGPGPLSRRDLRDPNRWGVEEESWVESVYDSSSIHGADPATAGALWLGSQHWAEINPQRFEPSASRFNSEFQAEFGINLRTQAQAHAVTNPSALRDLTQKAVDHLTQPEHETQIASARTPQPQSPRRDAAATHEGAEIDQSAAQRLSQARGREVPGLSAPEPGGPRR